MKYIKSLFLLLCLFFFSNISFGQDSEFSRGSLKTGLGLGFSSGEREDGVGFLYFFGYQRSYWKDRVRVSPGLTTGGFVPLFITDTRDQFFRITSLGVNGYVDAVRFRSVSLFLGVGGFVNYSRGLLGTGGDTRFGQGNVRSEYFNKLYYGGLGTAGIRISPKNNRLAYEFNPVNIQLGTDYFLLGYMKLGIDIKLGKLENKE